MSSNIFNHKYPREAAAFTQDRDFVWKHLFSGYELPQKSRFESQTKVLTMGSCFAVNISNALRDAGIDAQALRLHEEANSPLANFYLVDYLRKERWSIYRALFDKEIHASKCHEFRQLVKSAGLFRVLPSLEVKIMDKALIFIEKQVYKNGSHFGGEIPKGFEVFLRGHPSHIDSQFKCDQPQHRSTDFHSAS